MLRGDDDRIEALRRVPLVLDRHLALRIGAEPIDLALLAGFREAVEDPVGEGDRERHHLRRLVAGVAEHQPLVAGADVLARRVVLVDAHRDVAALLADGNEHGAGVGGDPHLVVGIADGTDHVTDDLLVVDRALGGDLTGHDRQACRHERLAGNTAERIQSEVGVEDAVRDLVGQLVGVAHADRFAREQILAFGHGSSPLAVMGALPNGIGQGQKE